MADAKRDVQILSPELLSAPSEDDDTNPLSSFTTQSPPTTGCSSSTMTSAAHHHQQVQHQALVNLVCPSASAVNTQSTSSPSSNNQPPSCLQSYDTTLSGAPSEMPSRSQSMLHEEVTRIVNKQLLLRSSTGVTPAPSPGSWNRNFSSSDETACGTISPCSVTAPGSGAVGAVDMAAAAQFRRNTARNPKQGTLHTGSMSSGDSIVNVDPAIADLILTSAPVTPGHTRTRSNATPTSASPIPPPPPPPQPNN